MNSQEQQYLDLITLILERGTERATRNGSVTKSIFGATMRFSLKNNTLPLLTTKKVFVRGIIEELLWFLRGDTDSKLLEAKRVNIWRGHTSREYLDSIGLQHVEEGCIGKGYGFQWRHLKVDQIRELIRGLRENPTSRRHILCSWNVEQLNEMALPPCHVLMQFYLDDKGLSCQLYQRSADVGLGLPFNIASYSILTHIIAMSIGVDANEFVHVIGDAHIYEPHFEQLREQTDRLPFEFPKLNIDVDSLESVEDIENLQYENFQVLNYQCHEAIKMIFVI